ncbi:acyl-CoA dehydrogenase family protein [Subtercola lobariae]|uniref:Acyl-CoA dehydrogenase n=1 Tax=Subtercola lobariae TaxID=1588641 RepID=A0A917B1V9_9MICO|nr:acyl-CoA dehydrogenase family protein [Subtercola lobariae]GGF17579.1 hypothetical protein GCM10011399_09160 [Subtercola lobariae]
MNSIASVSTVPSTDEILERARELVPGLRERLFETARLRHLPQVTIDEAEAAGLFRLITPVSLGGAGGGVPEYVELLRTLARADMSAAWTLGFFTAHAWIAAQYPEKAREVMFADGKIPKIAAVGRPPGRAVPVDGGFRVTGAWSYASGVMNADYAQVPAIIDGEHEASVFMVPVAEIEIIDTWFMSGMQGTGSNNLKLDDVFVPEYMVDKFDAFNHRRSPEERVHPEEMYTYMLGDFLLFIFPTIIVGAAETVLEEYRLRLDTRRSLLTPPEVQAETVAAQLRYARAISLLRVAQTVLANAVELSVQANRESTEDKTAELRANLKLDCLSLSKAAWDAVVLVVRGSGTAVFKSEDITQRFMHDIATALTHVTIDEDAMQTRAGQILLGRANMPDPAMFFV